MARKLERCEVMKMWVFSILNDKDVETWLRDNGYDIKNPNIAPIDVAVKSGSLIEIDEKHFATTKAKDEKTDTTWILDKIWKK